MDAYVTQLHDTARQLREAGHGQKGKIAAQACELLGINKDKLYRDLKKFCGWSSQRKKRADAGKTSIDQDTLTLAQGLMNGSRRANGKQTMHMPTVRSVLQRNGYSTLSASRMNELCRQANASAKQLAQATGFKQLRSLRPNHVHQVDPSLCVLYYLKNGRQCIADHDEFYQNKPQNVERISKLRVWRYVLVDHYSGLLLLRYYQSAGENQAILFDFLLYCWRKIGLPEILFTDKGSANMGSGIQNFCRQLGVTSETHAPGNSRAKGGAEGGNNLVETHFESLLWVEPVETIEELNASAEAWQEGFNNNTIPGINHVHYRHGQARYDMWQVLLAPGMGGELRYPPADDVCRYLMSHKQETRKVRGMEITFAHPMVKQSVRYCLEDIQGVYEGMTVDVMPLLVNETPDLLVGLQVEGELCWFEVQPLALDEAGFRLDAPVIGQEYKATADSVVDKARKAAEQAIYPGMDEEDIKKAKKNKLAPLGGQLVGHSDLRDIDQPARMKPAGETVEVEGLSKSAVEVETLDNVTLRIHVREALNRPLSPPEIEFLKSCGSVAESELPALTEQVATGLPTTNVTPLRAVN